MVNNIEICLEDMIKNEDNDNSDKNINNGVKNE